MKQNKSQLTGTGKVFSFTFLQFFKNKGNVISLILLMVMVLASVPLMTLIGGGSTKKADVSGIRTVYYTNETSVPLSVEFFAYITGAGSYYENTSFVSDQNPAISDLDVAVIFSEAQAASAQNAGYEIRLITAENSAVTEDDLTALEGLMTDVFNNARLSALQITNDQLNMLMSNWNIETEDLSDYLNPKDENKWSTQYFLQLAYDIIVMMLSIFSVSYITRAIVEEKSSKLVEVLMVSVKPLALIVGKILAALAYVFVMFTMLIAGYAISYYVTGLFLDVSATGNLFTQLGISVDLFHMGAFPILTILFSLLLGFLTFAIISGLSATGCSTTEDMQSAMNGSTFLIMFGYLISIFSGSADIPVVNRIVSLIPILSTYTAPVNYMMGNIGIITLILSWILQIAVIVLLALFCARIYENLLMYRGSRVKFSQMLSMAKQSQTGKEKD